MERYYEGGAIPWVKSGELRESYIGDTEEHITEAALKETSVKLIPPGAILLAMYGATVGRLGILSASATTNQAVCHIVPDAKSADVKYLFYALRSKVPTLVARGVGGAQPNISQAIVRDMALPLPPLAEQRRIADVLDRADALRAKRRAAVARIDDLLRATFVDMFGDPARNTKALPTLSLGELGKWQSGGTPPRGRIDYFEGSVPWFSSGELNEMTVVRSNENISDAALAETTAKQVPRGSLMLGMYDTAALKASIAGVVCSCNQAVAFSAIDARIAETAFVYFAIVVGREHFRRLQRGVRQKNLNLQMVREIRVPVPPLPLQREFARRLAAVDRLKAAHRASLAQLDELFASLQHRAFRGEL
jgi:type I restriction enzyme S subunit